MAEKSKLELIIDLVKALIWPVLIVCGIFWLGNDFKEILKNRKVNIVGVFEIGDRITALQSSLQDELVVQRDKLEEIALNSADSAKVHQLATQALQGINNTRAGVTKEIRNIQKAIPLEESAVREPQRVVQKSVTTIRSSSAPETAGEWEEAGFAALIAKNVTSALNAFKEAEKIRPDYHNVAEIRRLLFQRRETLASGNSQAWPELYRTILAKYSWGMPLSAREKMQQYLADR